MEGRVFSSVLIFETGSTCMCWCISVLVLQLNRSNFYRIFLANGIFYAKNAYIFYYYRHCSLEMYSFSFLHVLFAEGGNAELLDKWRVEVKSIFAPYCVSLE